MSINFPTCYLSLPLLSDLIHKDPITPPSLGNDLPKSLSCNIKNAQNTMSVTVENIRTATKRVGVTEDVCRLAAKQAGTWERWRLGQRPPY